MSKTIKQIADEIGVSKQAVQKRLSREPLCTSIQPYISTVGGVKYIEVVGEKLIKSAFSKDNRQPSVDNLSIDNNTVDVVVDVLKSQIETQKIALETLQAQLEVKDKQIEQLTAALQQQTSALESTTAALTAAQALHAADKKALILMDYKDKQSDSFYSDENMERTGESVHPERKLSFWERRAAKKARKENNNGKFGAD